MHGCSLVSGMTIPCVECVVLAPYGVSSFKSKFSQHKNLGEKLSAALKREDLPEVDRFVSLRHPINSLIEKTLPEACRIDLKSYVVKWISSTTNLDQETCQRLLRLAIMSGSIESVEALLNRGADLNLPCMYRNSVLVIAVVYLNQPDLMKMVKFLVQKGANVNRNRCYYSPLVVASLKNVDVVSYLLQNGADVNEVEDKQGHTSRPVGLIYAKSMYNTRRSTIEIVLSACADRYMSHYRNDTALHSAADTEIASLLIQAGADLEARNAYDRTPLLESAVKGRTDMINLLKKCGANMTAVDHSGNSALHLMVEKSDEPQEEIFRLFVFHCNQTNKHGMTPLMLAAEARHLKAVRILLELGADPNIINFKIRQPYTALSGVLDKFGRHFHYLLLACAEELITCNSMTGLPRCCWYFFKMIDCDQRRLVQLMMTHGMAPLCENVEGIRLIDSRILCDIPGKLSPLAFALVSNKLAIAKYLRENWFLTPADLVGSKELRHLRSKLERESQADGLRFMDENMSQPMSLLKLSFVAVSAQLGGVAGREERVTKTPLPNVIKEKLLFRRENFPMDFTG
ncbi:ankyrin repeat-containing protein [Plakobranchus ocellatus]|uniref:Ankyrin repeat-containing protein n=1 Tax=Plakobranchus ocellatus TaxID=259542 RepID=A0AAV4BD23_9GAST|nr:ankyrin repeat-containing protein [Plakobranchus ocellatus]